MLNSTLNSAIFKPGEPQSDQQTLKYSKLSAIRNRKKIISDLAASALSI